MTYGWAILIIAVVLVALFQLGVFNSSNFAPKAQAGACQVFRTVEGTSLEGTCNNMLPQYAAQFQNEYTYISIPNKLALSNPPVFTLMAWIYTDNIQAGCCGSRVYNSGAGGAANGYEILAGSGNLGGSTEITANLGLSSGDIMFNSANIATASWQFVALTFNSTAGNVYLYTSGSKSLNAVEETFGAGNTLGTWGGTECIGVYQCSPSSDNFNGLISNIQIYNTSLSANDVQALYQEGIGGTPFDLQNLVGWWPLNGNANDYSGNNNNGAATNVIYTGSWESRYSQP